MSAPQKKAMISGIYHVDSRRHQGRPGGCAVGERLRSHARAAIDALESRLLFAATVQFANAAETVAASAGTFSIPVTVAGSASPAVSNFVASGIGYASGVAADASGNLYVSDTTGQSIHKVTPAGTVTTFASRVGDATGVAIDSAGNVYVADTAGDAVDKVTPAGAVSTFARGFNGPVGLALGPTGDLFVTNRTGRTVSRATQDGTVTTFATGFTDPEGAAFDVAGNLFVADVRANVVKKVTPDGTVTTVATGFNQPEGVAVDSAGDLFVGNFGDGTISEVTPDGAVSTLSSGVSTPVYLAFDPSGNLFATAASSGVFKVAPPVSVQFTLGGSAVAGMDYSGVTASPLVIPLGQTTADITGSLATDAGVGRTLTFALGKPAGASPGSPTTNTLTIAAATPTPSPTPLPTAPSPTNGDPAFAGGGSVSLGFTLGGVATQSDGKIVLVGFEPGGTPGSTQAVIERLNTDGNPDATFGTGGVVLDTATNDEALHGIVIQPDGRIIVAGTSDGGFLLARYNPDGTLDPSWNGNGRVVAATGSGADVCFGVTVDAAGNVTCTGTSDGRSAVGHFTPDGAADTNFNGGAPVLSGGAGQPARVLAQVVAQADGSIIAVGSSGDQVIVTKVTAAGVLDPTFNPSGATPGIAVVPGVFPRSNTSLPDFTEGLALQPDGKILVANTDGIGNFGVARLNADGTPDTTFAAARLTSAEGDADAILLQTSDSTASKSGAGTPATRILVVGTGRAVDPGTSTPATQVVALHLDGTVDTTFGTNGVEVFQTGLSTGTAQTSLARPTADSVGGRTSVRPDAVNLGVIAEQVFAQVGEGGKLLVGVGGPGDTSHSSLRRLLVPATPTALPVGTLGANVSAKLPAALVGGSKLKAAIPVSVTVGNPSGSPITGPVGVSLFVSPTLSLDNATQVTNTSLKTLSLKAGKSRTLRLRVASLPPLTDNSYYLIAVVTSPDGTRTAVATSKTVQIAAPFVTTKVSNVVPAPSAARAGKTAGLRLTLTNTGNTTATGTAAVTVTLTPVAGGALGAISPMATPLKVKLPAKRARTFAVRFAVPAGLPVGGYALSVSLDVASLADSNLADGDAVSVKAVIVR